MTTLSRWSFFLLLWFAASSARAQDYLEQSKTFYHAVKGKDFAGAKKSVAVLAAAQPDQLKAQLNTEDKAKAFWLNLYNTFVAYSLGQDPGQFDDRGQFFKNEFIIVAGQPLSLDDIEHGIIRHSRNKLSMGYLGKVSVSEFEKKFRLAEIDWRVHFALNCGAKSCPPVSFYDWRRVQAQLDASTANYLKKFARYDGANNTVYAPMLCSWFRADFGGEEGIRSILTKQGIIPSGKSPAVKYLDYDWTLLLDNYAELP